MRFLMQPNRIIFIAFPLGQCVRVVVGDLALQEQAVRWQAVKQSFVVVDTDSTLCTQKHVFVYQAGAHPSSTLVGWKFELGDWRPYAGGGTYGRRDRGHAEHFEAENEVMRC